ncbi:MAG TPA: 1,2-phenylacetyl-CoA epoxidase subunit PaaE [Candidatus Lumbricidophila sp.]|nr:1,2-phenylacetyl-CoA epoxidase subunit PaaE [Candidatus Lumbricidophila sp.]
MSTAQSTKRRGQFHTLEVARVRHVTDDSIEVTFTVPDALADAYRYDPGQYIAIRQELEGEPMRRSYSICRAPMPGILQVGIKRDLGGVFSTWAVEHLAPGMKLEVMSPEGRFTLQHPDAPGRYAAVAAGSGITPVLSLIEHALRGNARSTFALIYSNRTAQDTMFVDELADLKDRYPSRLELHHVLTREQRSSALLSGRLDADRIERIFHTLVRPETIDGWFLCGPFELVQTCRDTLAAHGVANEQVRYELFTTDEGANSPRPQHGRPIVINAGTEVHTIEILLDGASVTVTSPKHSNETILNAALRVRSDAPFACAGGVCGTCRAVIREGTVEMRENYALEPDELDRGYVLTCQSVPTSDRVRVDYDA